MLRIREQRFYAGGTVSGFSWSSSFVDHILSSKSGDFLYRTRVHRLDWDMGLNLHFVDMYQMQAAQTEVTVSTSHNYCLNKVIL